MAALFSAEIYPVTHLNQSGQKINPWTGSFFVPNGWKKACAGTKHEVVWGNIPGVFWTQRAGEFGCQLKRQGRTKSLGSSQMYWIGLLNWAGDQLRTTYQLQRACCSVLTLRIEEALKCVHLPDGWIKCSIHSTSRTTAAMLLCS